MNADAHPKFYKPRSIPFLLKDKVEQELNVLQAKGIISPVQFSAWTAPIIPVPKKNGKLRICGDYKLTINQASPVETYQLRNYCNVNLENGVSPSITVVLNYT